MKNFAALLVLCFTTSLWANIVPGVTGVRTITHEGKNVELLTTAKGLTLYTFDPDGVDESNCYDSCAKAWPPIFITKEQAQKLDGKFSKATRRDGTLQLSFDGRPLYLFIGDRKAGDMKGDGLEGVWHIAIDEK